MKTKPWGGGVIENVAPKAAASAANATELANGTIVLKAGAQIKLLGTNDNFYYVKVADIGLVAGDGSTENRFLTTSDLGTLGAPVGSLTMGPIPEDKTPAGYLLCNGQAVSRTTYAALFDVIGTNFGSGDTSTTFNVPDYRDCFLRGLGTQNNNCYVKQTQGLPNIKGRVFQCEWGYFVANGAFYNGGSSGGRTANSGGGVYVDMDASKSNSIYQDSVNEVRPTNYAVNYFIKF